MRDLVLEMTETLFSERNDTHVSVIYPKDVSQLVESEPCAAIFFHVQPTNPILYLYRS